MAIPILGSILDSVFGKVGDIVSEVVVDKDKRNEINANLERLKFEAIGQSEQRIHEEVMGQLSINQTEAEHKSLFVAGWRPFVGWVSGAGLAYGVILEPLFSWTARVWFSYQGTFPDIDPALLIFALGGMLGIGTMRTVERIKGVATDDLTTGKASTRNIVPEIAYVSNPVVQSIPEDAPWQNR